MAQSPKYEPDFFDNRWPMQIFKQIIENECVNEIQYIPLSKAIIWQILRDNWKTVRDSMYYSLWSCLRLSIGIKISDLWMTLNGLMTAVERHLHGSWFFMWPSQFGRKLVLGTSRRWPRPKRDIGTSRGRLRLLFGRTVVLSVLVLNIVQALQQHLCCYLWFAVFANNSRLGLYCDCHNQS